MALPLSDPFLYGPSPEIFDSDQSMVMPLATGLRGQFENLFNCPLDGVTIHTGPQAERLGAAAFAVGDRIYFHPGAYAPDTENGRRLLGHELAHVVQYRQGRTPRGAWAAPPVAESSELEAEAERMGALARDIVPFEAAPAGREWHHRPLKADSVVQRSVLRRDNKHALFQALEDLVKQIPRTTHDLKSYVDELYNFVMAHPHIFSGEKFQYGDAKPGEKLPGTLNSKIPTYQIQVGQRIFLSALDNGDKKWIRRSLKRLADRHRGGTDYQKYSTRILSDGEKNWVNWDTSDCVFSAILIVLGLRFTGQGDTVKGYEETVETALANQLSIPMRTIPDHLLVYLLEERLQWKRQEIETLDDLYADAKSGNEYVVSYCEDAGKDFWHTVYGKCKSKDAWTWVDRQWERQNGTIRKSLKGDLSCEANAWLINDKTELVGTLREGLQVGTLKTTYKNHIE